jgi:hypothetical protein
MGLVANSPLNTLKIHTDIGKKIIVTGHSLVSATSRDTQDTPQPVNARTG